LTGSTTLPSLQLAQTLPKQPQAWEKKINLVDNSAPLLVENEVDLEGPPIQMEYINAYKVIVYDT
jgi:hypothetical protein